MSVLACSKNGCENVMCDTYVPEVGYVCYQCQRDFRDYMIMMIRTDNNEQELKQELVRWLALEKADPDEFPAIVVEEFFKRYTK